MNTLTMKAPSLLPRAIFLLAAFLLPHLASAGVFYSPANSIPQGNTQIVYYGSYGTEMGVSVPVQVKAPGSSTWVTIQYATTGYFGSLAVSTWYNFNQPGTWGVRVGGDAKNVQVN